MKKTILITIMIIIFCASLASATITYTLNSPDNLYATTSTSVTLDWNATSDDTTQPTGMTTWVYLSEVNNDTAVYNTSVLITNTTWGNTTTITSLAEGFYSWYLITNDSDGNTTSLSRWFEIRGSANESDFRWENETGFLAMKLNADNGNLNVYGILAALNLSGNVTWSDIYGFPSACPAGTYLTQLDDSVTCTAITNATGDFNIAGNISVDGYAVFNDGVKYAGGGQGSFSGLGAMVEFNQTSGNWLQVFYDESNSSVWSANYISSTGDFTWHSFSDFTALLQLGEGDTGIILRPNAGGITRIGDAGTKATTHGLVNNDDLLVTGKLEVDGFSYFDGNILLDNDANLTVEGNAVIHNEVIDIGIVGSTRNSSISVSKTVTVSDSSTVEIQNIWNYTAEGAGETALEVYAQTAPNNPYNVAGNMRGLEAYSEHLADTTVAGATAMAGIIRTGGGTISQSDAVLAFTSGVGGNITKANGFLASGLVLSGSVIDYTGLRIEELGNYGGTFSSNTGVMVEDVTVGTKNTGVLIGTDTAPEGNYSIYSDTELSSLIKGDVVINEDITTEGYSTNVEGNLRIGKTSTSVGTPNARFQHFWNYTAEGYGLVAMEAQSTISTTATVNMTGSLIGARIIAENYGAHTATEVIGAATYARSSVGTVTTAIGNSAALVASDASTIEKGIGFDANSIVLGGSNLGFTGFHTSVADYGGTFTRNIGLHVTDLTEATTNNIAVLIGADDVYPGGDYSIYSNTTSSSYFGGNILLDNDANVTWKNGASISVNSTCIILSSPAGTGTHAVCD